MKSVMINLAPVYINFRVEVNREAPLRLYVAAKLEREGVLKDMLQSID
jgi:hypothetical protein